MATREEVYSLFGIKSPQQVMAERQEQYANQLSRLSGAGQAGFGIGSGLRRLFGGESEQMSQARQMQEALSGVDTTDPEAIKQAAQAVSSFAPEAAIQMGAYALELEKTQRPNVEYREVITGYYDEPIVNPLTGMPTGEVQRKPIKDTAIIQNGEITGYTSGRGMSTGGEAIPGITDTPEAQAERAGTPSVTRRWNAQTGQMETVQEPAAQPAQGREVMTNVPAEAQERISMQTGPRGGTEGALGQINIPVIEGERTYINPEQAKVESDRIRDEITRLQNSNDPNKKEKIRELNKERMRIQKMRIASRRRGPSKDLTEQVRNLKRRLPE